MWVRSQKCGCLVTGWETKTLWLSPKLGSLLYNLPVYKIPLAQACFPHVRPNFHSLWRALVSQPVVIWFCYQLISCSDYIFVLDLTPCFNGLGKDNCKTRRVKFKFGDLVRLILGVLWYITHTYQEHSCDNRMQHLWAVIPRWRHRHQQDIQSKPQAFLFQAGLKHGRISLWYW